VNARLDDPAQRAGKRDKPIEVVRIVMDGEAVGVSARREMDLFSKFDRDPALAQALLAHGREQARRYLALRARSGQLWETLAQGIGAMGAQPGARLAQALPYLPGRERLAGGLVAPDVITVESAGQATLRWHASEAVLDGRTLRIKGSTLLKMGTGPGVWMRRACWTWSSAAAPARRGGQEGTQEGMQERMQERMQAQLPAPWRVAGEQQPDGEAGETLH